MMGVVEINLAQFALIYVLLLVVLFIMKKSKINQSKLLVVASFRMTVQLVLAGLVLTYILENPHPLFTVAYIIAMTTFATIRVLNQNKELNKKFKLAIGLSLAGSGTLIVFFFVQIVVGMDFFNPQYTIPLSGMIFGNAMTGLSLALKSFNENLKAQRSRVESLLYLGVTPKKILLPFVNNALETALVPTMNRMMGMGIISLPGMMTGQILSGTLPMTAILYQIAIMIAITAVVCLAVFAALIFGYKTLYNDRNQITI
ncbi:iron export ABC transporter permease subunit FetB [Proteiniclasticum sp. SCR006]|uniref:Iron export ABC transporter permease subunit FetB n=2 Tax=Proteiniclasticum aestuarii TaxID=2817862 RepID=A0A939HE22_9CLOT|nr:iron export ABC transporter permease subunit FetB [Proteiniclasticum aestuarii]